MKALLLVLVLLLSAGLGYTFWEVQTLEKNFANLQKVEKSRYSFLTSMHIYALQERETLDILAKLIYARLNRLEGSRDVEGTIRKLDEQYERAQKTTEQEWEMLKKNFPAESQEFALQYKQWLSERALAPAESAK